MSTTTFLLEIGTEEIPARMAPAGVAELKTRFLKEAAALHLDVSDVRTAVTPRRLVLAVGSIPVRQADVELEVTGPPAKAAFRDGQPTKAAEGFARGQGVDVGDLYTVDTPKGPYVAVRKHISGRPVAELLQEALPRLISSLPWPKSMRWGREPQAFVRPVHWIVALLGADVIPFEYAGIASGNTTRGHRFMAPTPFTVEGPDDYFARMADASVLLDPEDRRARIQSGVTSLATEAGGQVIADDGLVEEVTQLVEWPVVTLGSFAQDNLALPKEVLITSMRSHQRYFAVEDGDGGLLPRFVVVSNTQTRDPAVVTRGNERVLAARLSDARFFFGEDKKKPLADYVDALEDRIFLAILGTVRAKAERIQSLAAFLAQRLAPDAASTADRAALLCKADLATHMVGEFPDLQGVMGREYARSSGETDEVATAIFEHYLPRFAGDSVPDTDAGAIVSVADKMDSLVGCFGIGLLPTGTQDPYALRRGALGIIHTFQAKGWRLGLSDLISAGIVAYGDKLTRTAEETRADLLDFFRGRLKSMLTAEVATDVVDAVLATGDDVLIDLVAKVRALSTFRQREDFEPLAAAFKRVMNITKGQEVGPGGPEHTALVEEAEVQLLREAETRGEASRKRLVARDFEGALAELALLKPSVDGFFDKVMVMAEDPDVRRNRLALLVQIRSLFSNIADFSRIQTPASGSR